MRVSERGVTFSYRVVVVGPSGANYGVPERVDRTAAVKSPVVSANPHATSTSLQERERAVSIRLSILEGLITPG